MSKEMRNLINLIESRDLSDTDMMYLNKHLGKPTYWYFRYELYRTKHIVPKEIRDDWPEDLDYNRYFSSYSRPTLEYQDTSEKYSNERDARLHLKMFMESYPDMEWTDTGIGYVPQHQPNSFFSAGTWVGKQTSNFDDEEIISESIDLYLYYSFEDDFE